jgi:hypothetical protein
MYEMLHALNGAVSVVDAWLSFPLSLSTLKDTTLIVS